MAAWSIDLTTRAGARTAARTAGTACLLYATATAVGGLFVLFAGATALQPGPGQTSLNILPFLLAGFAAITGFRLQAGKGLYWGAALALVIALELLARLAAFSGIFGIVLCLVVLIFLIQGLRGARALQAGTGFEDDDIEAFS
ncbi:MAG: hypothetical protein ACKOPG_09770 [Novosphingobium sp.]